MFLGKRPVVERVLGPVCKVAHQGIWQTRVEGGKCDRLRARAGAGLLCVGGGGEGGHALVDVGAGALELGVGGRGGDQRRQRGAAGAHVGSRRSVPSVRHDVGGHICVGVAPSNDEALGDVVQPVRVGGGAW